jgi:hypothetical protein
MANDQDINRIIDMIDRKIRALSQARKVLVEEFGGGKVELSRPETPELFTRKLALTSKEKIAELLTREGPLPRKAIAEKTALRHGTLSFALNDKRLFRLKDGKWYLAEGGGDTGKE